VSRRFSKFQKRKTFAVFGQPDLGRIWDQVKFCTIAVPIHRSRSQVTDRDLKGDHPSQKKDNVCHVRNVNHGDRQSDFPAFFFVPEIGICYWRYWKVGTLLPTYLRTTSSEFFGVFCIVISTQNLTKPQTFFFLQIFCAKNIILGETLAFYAGKSRFCKLCTENKFFQKSLRFC